MNLEPSAEQRELVEATARFLAEHLPVSRLRQTHTDTSPEHWRGLAGLGVFGITLAEGDGGLGLGMAEETLIFRELGRQLVTPATLATVVARRIALLQGDTALAAQLARGEIVCGIAIPASNPAANGQGRFLVFDGQLADCVLMVDEARSACVPRVVMRGRLADRPLDDSLATEAAGAALPAPHPAWCVDVEVTRSLAVLTSATLVGLAESVLQRTVEHARQRQQFGAPIGSFQAIKHLCADDAVRIDAAWAQTLWAALSVQEGVADCGMHVAAAAMLAEEAARHAAQDAVQIHGAMGFTVECDVHRFVKRRHVLGRILTHAIDAQREMIPDRVTA